MSGQFVPMSDGQNLLADVMLDVFVECLSLVSVYLILLHVRGCRAR
jgi:hypothetical protein